jgi:hypothetical protein
MSRRRCENCGCPLPKTKRLHARTCSNACRQMMVRRRQGVRPRDPAAEYAFDLAEIKMQTRALSALIEKQLALR